MDNKTITISMVSGPPVVWASGWDDYEYLGTVFVVKNAGAWVGIYNMKYVRYIMVD